MGEMEPPIDNLMSYEAAAHKALVELAQRLQVQFATSDGDIRPLGQNFLKFDE